MEEKKETKYDKHNKKRIRITISFYHEHRVILNEKIGFIPNATQARDMLINGEVKVITKNIDPMLPEAIVLLRKIGNNINQMANLANAKKEAPVEANLKIHLMKIREVIDQLKNFKA
jgi:hypothetical protein